MVNLELKTTDLSVICGKRGSGKTTLSKALLDFLISTKAPIRIIDPLYEYREYAGRVQDVKFIRYQDRASFNAYLKSLFGKWKGVLVIDEADGFFPSMSKLEMTESDFVNIGRHYGIGALMLTRRLSMLNTNVISNANKLFIFKLWSPADLGYLERADLGHLVPYISGLDRHYFLSIDTDNGEIQVNEPIGDNNEAKPEETNENTPPETTENQEPIADNQEAEENEQEDN